MTQSENLRFSPIQWASGSDFQKVKPLEKGDFDCLSEIQSVIEKHGKASRLGITLLKSSFEISENETLVEYTNIDSRFQQIEVQKLDSVKAAGSIETNWVLNDGDIRATLSCVRYCAKNIHGNHDWFHK